MCIISDTILLSVLFYRIAMSQSVHGNFDSYCKMKNGLVLMDTETAFSMQMFKNGYKCSFCSVLAVQHFENKFACANQKLLNIW